MKLSVLILNAVVAANLDDPLFWGTYRPQPYVGLRSRSEDSPLFGLLWYKPSLGGQGLEQLRHTCSYYDQLSRYGWQEHDGQSYGYQTIEDPLNNVQLTVNWVKPDENEPSHWVLRVQAEQLEKSGEQEDLSIMWYGSSPDDVLATFDPESGSIHGHHDSVDRDYWLSAQGMGMPAEYKNDQDTHFFYDQTYYSALTVDEHD